MDVGSNVFVGHGVYVGRGVGVHNTPAVGPVPGAGFAANCGSICWMLASRIVNTDPNKGRINWKLYDTDTPIGSGGTTTLR